MSNNWISSAVGTPQNPSPCWSFVSGSGLQRTSSGPGLTSSIRYVDPTLRTYTPNKSYIFKTQVSGFDSNNGYLEFFPSWSFSEKKFIWSNIVPTYTNSELEIITGTGQGSPLNVICSTYSLMTTPIAGDTNTTLFYISRPPSITPRTDRVKYASTTNGFNGGFIKSFDIIEVDWLFLGYCFATSSNSTNDEYYEGWRYDNVSDTFTFKYFGSQFGGSPNYNKRLPAGTIFTSTRQFQISSSGFPTITQKKSIEKNTNNNYISRFISYPKFNISFNFTTNDSINGFVDVYLISTDFSEFPKNIGGRSTVINNININNEYYFRRWLASGQKLGRISAIGSTSFYNLDGNNYIVFVANYSETANLKYSLSLNNFLIEGSYSKKDNNEKFLFTNTDVYYNPTPLNIIGAQSTSTFSVTTTTEKTLHNNSGDFSGATGSTGSFSGFYSNLYGTVENLSQLSSRAGNGTFRSGIWENGVWNNGMRVDEGVYDFYDIPYAISLSTQNLNWRIQITGSTQSVSQFNTGDKVSVGNIISIDINENRKILKNYFTIVDKTDTELILETVINFPILNIQKDSDRHNIKISKNVWLNGGFFNGYFKGIWNDGLFRGYPYITEMFDSHWVDGIFDGGHFQSTTATASFIDTFYSDGYLGFTFSTPHGFLVGDKVIVDKDNKDLNPNYDGLRTISSVPNKNSFVTELLFGQSSTLESGKVTKYTSTGLIQNFKFNSNNVAKLNSTTSTILKQIWSYNSWIDVNYLNESSTSINRLKTSYNYLGADYNEIFLNKKYGLKEYSVLNLYGFITKDVLSSQSIFRDINSFTKRNYSLGIKYKIYEDFLGEISNFNSPFASYDEAGGLTNFTDNGWNFTFSEKQTKLMTWRFTDNSNAGAIFPGESDSLSFKSVTPPPFNEGDEIFIEQDGTFTNASYEGLTTVRGISFSNPDYYVITDKPFGSPSPIEPGTISSVINTSPDGYTFSRTVDGTFKLENTYGSNQLFILDNENITIEKNRYSAIEFDLVSYNTSDVDYNPIDLFNIKNFTNNDFSYSDKKAFPQSGDVDYRNYSTKKIEYFFNRFKLNLGILSKGWQEYDSSGTTKIEYNNGSTVELDNIKFYEIDMVPFFQYTTEDYVNQSVQVPYLGLAPYIDYSDTDFVFVDNIKISNDSIILDATNTTSVAIPVTPPIFTTTSSSGFSSVTGLPKKSG
jgi:hypothetical protein